MKTTSVRMLSTQSGRHPGFFVGTGQYHCRLGHTYDVPAELAAHWLRADPPVAEATRKPKRTEPAVEAEEEVTDE